MRRMMNRLSVLFLMLLGVLPQLALLTESLQLGVRPRLWLWLLGLCLCFWVSACFRRGLLIGMPGAALVLYAAHRLFEAAPIKELDDVVDKFSGAYYLHYYDAAGSYNYLNAVEDHSFLLLLLACLLFAYLSSALTSRSGRRLMCLLGSVPLPAACLSVNGVPSYAGIVALLLFWSILLLAGNYEEEGAQAQLVFSYTLPVLLLLCGILMLCRPQDYRIEDRDLALSQQFDKIGDWIRNWIDEHTAESPLSLPGTEWVAAEETQPETESMLWESAEGSMDLTQNYDEQTLSKVFLRVRAQRDGTLYLRGISYGDYTGTGWSAAPDAPVSSLSFTAEALRDDGQRAGLSCEQVLPLRYALLPYYCTLNAGIDAYYPASDTTGIEYYRYTGELSGVIQTKEEERIYADYAHEAYTRLPESTREVMLSVAREAGLDIGQPDLVERAAAFVRDAGEYDTGTDPYPSGDYAVYFLTQAHRGYCVHFATAAAALYRALGVPARIAEGFLVQGEKGRTVDVRGENAHAWVEIYRDGLGWIPVEVTGRGGLQPIPDEPAEPEITEEPVGTGSEEADETPLPGMTEPQVTPAPLPVGIVQEQAPSPAPGRESRPFPLRFLRLLLILALLPALAVGWRSLMMRFWFRRMHTAQYERAAVAIWKRSVQAAAFGGSVPEEITKCAEKAVFSARGVTAEELAPCYERLNDQIEQLHAALPFAKRLVFRFVYGFK